jgi:hypothetical protein
MNSLLPLRGPARDDRVSFGGGSSLHRPGYYHHHQFSNRRHRLIAPTVRAAARSRVQTMAEPEARAWFVSLLWRAFPEARNEAHLEVLVAQALTSENSHICQRTVRNWIRQDNTPHFRYLIQLLALAGVESVFQLFDPGDPHR